MSGALRTQFAASLAKIEDGLKSFDGVVRFGRVSAVTGPLIRASVPEARIGGIVRIRRATLPPLVAEVIGFDRQDALLMPLGTMEGVEARAVVEPSQGERLVPVGDSVRGRVLDALGEPIDGLGPLGPERAPAVLPPPNPLKRTRIHDVLPTGVRTIDGLLTLGRGQRIGIFAAAGGGKTTLLASIARNVKADRVVLALIGERGREVRGFLEDDLGEEGLKKATVVVSTSEQPALLRLKAAYTATAIAEYARQAGENVVLMMDSVTRFARALRDVGLAAGEPPGRQGYPASVYAELPRLFERAGNDERGSITGIYTVLVSGDDIQEPVADETMSLLDGHFILSRKLAARSHYPAIDVTRSKSRVRNEVISKEHRSLADRVLGVVGDYEENYDKITLGMYEHPETSGRPDPAAWYPVIEKYLKQDLGESCDFDEALSQLAGLIPRAAR